MKFFENIDKIQYNTDLGYFKVSNIATYFSLDLTQTTIANTEITKNTTLIELASGLYGDGDSIWSLLYANNSINPFTLTNEDTISLLSTYQSNKLISSINVGDGKDVIIPAGSLILPPIENSGTTWEFGSTGNFSLTGGFALVQSFDPFTKIATILEPYGGITFSINDPLNFIIKGDTYYYYFSPSGGLTNTISYIQIQSNGINRIKYKDNQTFQVYGLMEDDSPVTQKGSAAYLLSGATVATTYEESAQNLENKISYFITENSNYFNLNKIEQNYVI